MFNQRQDCALCGQFHSRLALTFRLYLGGRITGKAGLELLTKFWASENYQIIQLKNFNLDWSLKKFTLQSLKGKKSFCVSCLSQKLGLSLETRDWLFSLLPVDKAENRVREFVYESTLRGRRNVGKEICVMIIHCIVSLPRSLPREKKSTIMLPLAVRLTRPCSLSCRFIYTFRELTGNDGSLGP